MTRGRKPKPTIEKQLAGNPGKRALNLSEPKPQLGLPPRPAYLTGDARREWERVAKDLYRLGLLANIDRSVLAAYCAAVGTFVEAEEQLKNEPLTIVTDKGNIIQNPLVGIRNTAIQQFVKIAAEFGMTPSSRTRIHAEPPEKEKSLAEQLFEMLPAAPVVKPPDGKSNA
jgi:P27 family predicted phage terminase small subunit